jgi:hypothetical protein
VHHYRPNRTRKRKRKRKLRLGGRDNLARLLLGDLCYFWTERGGLALFSSLVASAELVEAKRSRPEMDALVETALVADNLARIESRTAPGGGLCCVTIEAAPAEILGHL